MFCRWPSVEGAGGSCYPALHNDQSEAYAFVNDHIFPDPQDQAVASRQIDARRRTGAGRQVRPLGGGPVREHDAPRRRHSGPRSGPVYPTVLIKLPGSRDASPPPARRASTPGRRGPPPLASPGQRPPRPRCGDQSRRGAVAGALALALALAARAASVACARASACASFGLSHARALPGNISK